MSILKGQAEPQQNVGRFQIINSSYVAVSGRTEIKTEGLFKIDTATGRTWLFFTGLSKDNQYVQKWTLIDE
jgi:hypothetical protein